MSVLSVLLVAVVVLGGGGRLYSRFLARRIGEDPSRPTPAVTINDGRDYVPTPTPVVFAHHFASIAGAGPILGPVIAIIYGWAPALAWVLGGGLLIGAVHDYLATYITTREGGQSVATVLRRIMGKDAFVAMMLLLVVMLALVCAAFLNYSAQALVSRLPFDRLGLTPEQTLFRVQDDQAVIGGIASMSVIVITAFAPLIGWMYIKKHISVWLCSLAAITVCTGSIVLGLYYPVAFPQEMSILGVTLKGMQVWMLLLSAYVLVAAGVPVWLLLQSRDFTNVHILYVGMVGLFVTLVVGGVKAACGALPPVGDPLPAFNVAEGTAANGWIWPGLFILIACGAVSGFHSLCAGGTTCKQITSERAARQIGFYGMLLESFLAVCVIAALMLGTSRSSYLTDLYPRLVASPTEPNAVLGFAMALGQSVHLAFGVPIAVGAVAGMVLLEGFIVTTLDTAVRLTRYLIEEIWRTLFAEYDIFAEPVTADAAQQWGEGEPVPIGAEGLPVALTAQEDVPGPAFPTDTTGPFRWLLRALRHYWVNSGLAVGLMLLFAFTGGQQALWGIFATSNQLLAGMVLAVAALWLARQGRSFWFALLPSVAMMVTTVTSLVLLLIRFTRSYLAKPPTNLALLIADVIILIVTLYLLYAGLRTVRAGIGASTVSKRSIG